MKPVLQSLCIKPVTVCINVQLKYSHCFWSNGYPKRLVFIEHDANKDCGVLLFSSVVRERCGGEIA